MRVAPQTAGRSSSSRRPPVALLTAVLVALAGCGGSKGETSRASELESAAGAAQTRVPDEKAELAARLSAACRQATEGMVVRRPDGAKGLGAYARGSIIRTQRTLAELTGVQVPRAAEPQVTSLRAALTALAPLYEQAAQAAAERDRAALGRLVPVIPAAEQSAGELARGLGAPACAPGG